MTSSFFSFLKSIFRPMSVSMASKSDNVQQNSSFPSEFLPLTVLGLDIFEYMRHLRAEAVATSEGRVELSKHMVTKLEHMKEKKGVEHEYVVATVKYNDTEVRLSIERTKGAELPKNSQRKESLTKISSSRKITLSSIPNSSQDSLFKPTWARDMIRNIGHETSRQPSHILNTFSPHLGALNLLQLATIIDAVHDLEERYAPLRAQCYWFAMLVMGAAMVRGGQLQSSTGGKAETVQVLPTVASTSNLNHIPISPPPLGETMEVPEAPVVEGGVGKHLRIPIVAVEPKDIQHVAEEAERRYNDELVAMEAIWTAKNQRTKELEEENKKKDEELMKKDEELRKKDELIRQLLSQQQAESSRHQQCRLKT